MRCRDKLAIEHPDKVYKSFIGGCYSCPHSYEYLDVPEWCDVMESRNANPDTCTKCWDREIPGTLPTNKYEDKFCGCGDCVYTDKAANEEPCKNCKHAIVTGDRRHDTAPHSLAYQCTYCKYLLSAEIPVL